MVRSLFAGSLVMPGVLSELLANDGTTSVQPNGGAHFPARAKRVIFLYMTGGVSHIESFDHKPEFIRRGRMGTLPKDDLAPPTWGFAPGGQCGTQVNDIFPHLRECADDLCVIKSMTTTRTITSRPRSVCTPVPTRSNDRALVHGSATGWERRTATCPPSSCSHKSRPTAARHFGARTFFPDRTEARASNRVTIRCVISSVDCPLTNRRPSSNSFRPSSNEPRKQQRARLAHPKFRNRLRHATQDAGDPRYQGRK